MYPLTRNDYSALPAADALSRVLLKLQIPLRMGVVEVKAQHGEEVWYVFPCGEIQTSDRKVIFTSLSVPSAGAGPRCCSQRSRNRAADDFAIIVTPNKVAHIDRQQEQE